MAVVLDGDTLAIADVIAVARRFDRVEIGQVRPHKGQVVTAANILKLTANSAIIASQVHCGKVQDAYSLDDGTAFRRRSGAITGYSDHL